MFIAPVAMHRAIFRKNKKDELVAYTAKLIATGLVFLALSMLGALLLILDFVVHSFAAWIATAVLAVVFGVFWYLLPIGMGRRLNDS
jgi:membrane-bound ClpP family serine protease